MASGDGGPHYVMESVPGGEREREAGERQIVMEYVPRREVEGEARLMTRDINYEVRGIIGPRIRLDEAAQIRRVPESRSATARILERFGLLRRSGEHEAEQERADMASAPRHNLTFQRDADGKVHLRLTPAERGVRLEATDKQPRRSATLRVSAPEADADIEAEAG